MKVHSWFWRRHAECGWKIGFTAHMKRYLVETRLEFELWLGLWVWSVAWVQPTRGTR
jgi:hypothetical protein